jgi:DNA-binding NarL/FixJ family response regulator
MIRVVVVDDHPALRAGLHTVLDAEPGLVYAGESNGEEEHIWPILTRVRPDLLLLDYHLPRGDGLQLCYRIKQQVPAPKVALFTAYASPSLALPASLACADAVLDKGLGARELFESIRRVNAGERLVPAVSQALLEDTARRLDREERTIMCMLLDGASHRDVAGVMQMDPRQVRHTVQRILSVLRLEMPRLEGSAA